jgi:hypothetical protein
MPDAMRRLKKDPTDAPAQQKRGDITHYRELSQHRNQIALAT